MMAARQAKVVWAGAAASSTLRMTDAVSESNRDGQIQTVTVTVKVATACDRRQR